MHCNFLSRRHFLEGCAATLGVALVGCSGDSASPKTQAVIQGKGFVIKDAIQVEQLERGQALSFEFPGNVAGLLFLGLDGKLAAVNAICTHAGCLVNWNGKNEFDCPCHGSKFTERGKVIQGPAEKPLPFYGVKLQNGDAILTPA